MKKILVIEDEIQTMDLFLSCLEVEGYQTIKAKNGLVGVQEAQKHLPDLVICDILMPELDGYSVLSRLRHNSITETIPFIFLTASMTKAELPKSNGSETAIYLAKPTTVDELLEAIAIQLERQSNQCYHRQKKLAQPSADLTPPVSQSIFPLESQLNDVFEFIEANYHQSITLNDVAQAVGYSPAYLTNLVGCRTGRTVTRWIVERRMAEARSLLQRSNWSVDQIAHTVGYTNVRHFFRQFRQHHGITPQDWRKRKRVLEIEVV